MAANKFATMLHRNTNKITLILTYALLEWILIVLLLLNSLFSHLIIKFADYFGLKPPCPWCTRLDHLFDPATKGNKKSIPRDLLCEAHSKEISKLGYCANHGKLVESESMCEDCFSSSKGSPKYLSLFPWMKGFGKVRDCGQGVCENAEVVSLNCSCCGVGLNYNFNYNYNSVDAVSNVYSSYELVKTSSLDVLDSGEVENFVTEKDCQNDVDKLEDKNDIDGIEKVDASCVEVTEKGIEENVPSVSAADDEMKEFQGVEGEKMEVVEEMEEKKEALVMKDKSIQVSVVEEEDEEDDGGVSPKHLEYFLDYNGHGLVPFELIDPITEENKMTEDSQILGKDKLEDKEPGLDSEDKEELVKNGRGSMEVDNLLDIDINEEAKVAVLNSMELEEDENSLVFHAKDRHLAEEKYEQFPVFPVAHFPDGEEKHSDIDTASEDVNQIGNNDENEADVSIGTEIPDLDVADEIENQDFIHSDEYTDEDHLPNSDNVYEADNHDSVEEQMVQLQSLIVQHEEHPVNNQHSSQLELNENEEVDVPDAEEVEVPDANDSIEEQMVQLQSLTVQHEEHPVNNQNSSNLELNENEGDEVPDDHDTVEEQMLPLQSLTVQHEEHPVNNQNSSQLKLNENEGDEVPDDHDTVEEQMVQLQSLTVHCEEHPENNQNSSHLELNENEGDEVPDDQDTVEEQMVQLQSLTVQREEHPSNNQHSSELELSGNEEDKVPDTPTSSSDSFMQLHKKLLLLEKRDSGTEESLDSASVTSELEGGEGVVTVEHLKSALKAERKALQVLYSELEEERSASAIAASQTMAMINRLQEEKAAMQMEALQYQRMMEEQSEYDQEALQLLNELMVKREKEKQDLEKELEAYRKKLFDYESREKMRRLRRSKDGGSTRGGFSSTSCSNAEDSDGLSIDLNQDGKEEDGFYSHDEFSNHNTPVDAVLKLEESLADFEEERISILEQLKGLEEKLMTMDDDEEQHYVDGIQLEENGDHVDGNGHVNGESNGHENGFSSEVKHHNKRKSVGQNGKSLLPLFDATTDDNEDSIISTNNGDGIDGNGVHDSYDSKSDMESKKFLTEEEVDHLYERLQALEADREFLKHCISSVKKGDKGVDLLQEILQHLRDLRNVELRVRNLTDSPAM